MIATAPARAEVSADASAVLGAVPQWNGMDGNPGDADKDIARNSDVVSGRACWRATSPGNSFLYFDVHSERIPAGAHYAMVDVTYFDEPAGALSIQYDAESNAYQQAETVTMGGSGSWKTHHFVLPKINFKDRQNGGSDFRIGASSPAKKACVAEVSVRFAATADLAVTNTTLLFDTGAGTLRLDSQADTVAWTITDRDGGAVAQGTANVVDAHAQIDVSSLPQGYYRFEATATVDGSPSAVSTTFAVLDELPAGAIGADSPYGVGTHFGQSWDPSHLEEVRKLGFAHIRDDITWGSVETSPGQYVLPAKAVYAKMAGELGIDLMPVAAYGNPFHSVDGRDPDTDANRAAYAAYVSALVGLLRDSGAIVEAVDVWNEFNHPGFNNFACGTTPECYLPLLAATASRVRADYNDVKVGGPSTAGAVVDWNTRLIGLGALDSMDAFSIHPYRYPSTPEGMVPELQALNNAIAAAGHDTPLWLTEMGWPTQVGGGTTEAQQADYLVRMNVLAQSQGAERVYWYDLLNDGTNPAEREHNFGLLTQPTATVAGAAPKPAAMAQAVMVRTLAGATFQGADEVADGVHSYRYADGGGTTRVLWAEGNATVQIVSTGTVTVTDVYGKTWTLARGGAELQLDGSPLYVSGGTVQTVEAVEQPLMTIEPSGPAIDGEDISVDVTIDRQSAGSVKMSGRLTLDVQGITSQVIVPPDSRKTVTVRLPGAGIGEEEIRATLSAGDRTFAIGQLTVKVTDRLSVEVFPDVSSVDPLQAATVVNITNHSATTDLTVEAGAKWSVGEATGRLAEPLVVPPLKSAVLGSLPLDAAGLWDQSPYLVDLVAGGTARHLTGAVGLAPLEQHGAAVLPPIDLATKAVWVKSASAWGGADNLSGTVRLTAEDGALIVTAEITDDAHRTATSPMSLWENDSIQVAITPQLPNPAATVTEIGFGDTTSGPEVYTFHGVGEGAITAGATAAVARDEAASTTTYEARIPWSSLGFSGRPTTAFGISLLVNDNDTGVRRGWLEWGSGVGSAKNPSLFRVMSPVSDGQ